MDALLLGIGLQLASGCAALLLSRHPRAATVTGASGAGAGCLLGLAPTVGILLGGTPESFRRSWDAAHGAFHVQLDALGAFFLLPVLGLSALAAVYGGKYLLAYRREKALGGPWFFFNVFVAGMIVVLIARTILLFLVAWEVMSLAAYCLVTFEHEKSEVRQAGWIYLIAAHLGVIFLFWALLLIGRQAGSGEFHDFAAMPAFSGAEAGLVFVLALVGFGTKAGLVPLHVWLPEAHPAAPSHVSALMSGVMIKMGIYGLLRVVTFLGAPAPWWGLTLAGIGLLTALVGIALAVYQRDLKRGLAYSSIENIGLIALALGVGLWGWASGQPAVAVLGMSAGLLHVWNHALMKGLMFFAVGSVAHSTGAKDMEKLGGLMKRMPWTGNALLVGAVAIAALPPLNGFVSKWLIYLSLMKCGLPSNNAPSLVALLTIGFLALVGGLASITLVRLVGIVLLGAPRSAAAEQAHESSAWLIAPMQLLLFLCLAVALLPQIVVGSMGTVLEQILGADARASLLELQATDAPLAVLGNVNAWTLIAGVTAAMGLLALTRKRVQAQGPTWGCGYVQPTARMQYTGRSFAEMIAEHVLPRLLRPRTSRTAPQGLFPSGGEFAAECPEPVRARVYEPFFRRWANRFARLRFLQQGKVHIYLVYIMLMVVLALAWASLRTWWGAS